MGSMLYSLLWHSSRKRVHGPFPIRLWSGLSSLSHWCDLRQQTLTNSHSFAHQAITPFREGVFSPKATKIYAQFVPLYSALLCKGNRKGHCSFGRITQSSPGIFMLQHQQKLSATLTCPLNATTHTASASEQLRHPIKLASPPTRSRPWVDGGVMPTRGTSEYPQTNLRHWPNGYTHRHTFM